MRVRIVTKNFYGDCYRLFHRLNHTDFNLFSLEEYPLPNLLVFSGGADISPSIYGEENVASHTIPMRDEVEIEAYTFAVKHHIPCFGICRGHQLLNALIGGKLTQHIENPHPMYHRLDNGLEVNSMHHQGVISTPLDILASFRGVAEITQGHNIFSVQFHPEFENDKNMDEVVRNGLEMLW